MRICDICKKEENNTLAKVECVCCARDLCGKHTHMEFGKYLCPDCTYGGEDDCPRCELPLSLCSCSVAPLLIQSVKNQESKEM